MFQAKGLQAREAECLCRGVGKAGCRVTGVRGFVRGEAGLVHRHCSWRFLSQAEEFKLHAI